VILRQGTAGGLSVEREPFFQGNAGSSQVSRISAAATRRILHSADKKNPRIIFY
jgi:hypothetical protein